MCRLDVLKSGYLLHIYVMHAFASLRLTGKAVKNRLIAHIFVYRVLKSKSLIERK